MGLHYAAGPVVVFAVLALLSLFLRWAFGTGSTRRRPTPSRSENGLLVRVATASGREAALALRAVLSDAGIRSTLRLTAADRVEILVFPEDADRARALAATFPT